MLWSLALWPWCPYSHVTLTSAWSQLSRVLNRNSGRGVRPTQRNPDPVQDTKDVNFATLSKRKCCNFLPCSRLDQAGRIQNTKNGTQVCVFTHFNEGARNQRKLCDERGRKGDLQGRPCLRHENLKMYTLFKTEDPENDTLTVGTSLPRKYMGVPPPPPGGMVGVGVCGSLCGVGQLRVPL